MPPSTDRPSCSCAAGSRRRSGWPIPLDLVGGRCRIVAERGAWDDPAARPGRQRDRPAARADPDPRLGVHPRGSTFLVTGWAKGGKSEVLLAFAARGATYVGDEWIYLADRGRRMVGLPEPIRLWDWQLRQMPEFAARVSRAQRAPDRLDPRRGQRDRGGRRCAGDPRDRRAAGRSDGSGRSSTASSTSRSHRPPVRRPDRGRWGTARSGRVRREWRGRSEPSSSRSTAARSPGGWSTRSATNGSTCGPPT